MPRLVVFDLDGTISRRDTLVPYVLQHALRHRPWRLAAVAGDAPRAMLRFMTGRSDRGELKGRLTALLLGGLQRADIDRWNAGYLPRLLGRGLFAGALERIASHRSAGDHLHGWASRPAWISTCRRSAAPGFAETVQRRRCAAMRSMDTSQRPTGDEEKARVSANSPRLRGIPTSAYGISSSDSSAAPGARQSAPVLVNARGSLRQAAERSGRPFEFVYRRWRGAAAAASSGGASTAITTLLRARPVSR
ncbi:MAG: haloacid dehalogenase-like hydrolase [Steroidobacteraceae bacterium]